MKKNDRFQKNVYKVLNDVNLNLLLIQYIGDETVCLPQAHGNSMKKYKPYFQTKPSVLNKVKEHSAKNPVSIMNKINSEINASCNETGFSHIRIKRRVINTQAR